METTRPYESEPKRYEFFKSSTERQELFDYSRAIAEYIRREKISNLVMIDRSSRPFYIGVKEYFRSQYPNEKMPNFYFMNPQGFKARGDLSDAEIDEIADYYDWIDDADPPQVRVREDIMHEFQDVYQKLMKDKENPILVFDTCIHSGDSLWSVKKVLEESGFSDVRIGVVNPHDIGSKVKADFCITEMEAEKGCYPFGHEQIIEKTFDHVYSKRTTNKKDMERSIRLRKEIKQIVGDYLKR